MYTYIFSFSFIIYILLYCLAAIYFSRRCIKDTQSNWYRLLFFNKFKVTPLLCIPNDLYYHSSSNGILKLILIACWHKYNRFYFLFCFLGMHMSTEIDLKKKKTKTKTQLFVLPVMLFDIGQVASCHYVVQSLSRVQLFEILWTVARQAPLHGIFQARTLEWVTIFSSSESSWPRDLTPVSCIAGRFLKWG